MTLHLPNRGFGAGIFFSGHQTSPASPLMVLGGRWHGEMSRAVGAASTGEVLGSRMLHRAEPPPRRARWWLRQDPAPLLLPAKQGEGSSTLPLASK